MIRVFSEVSRCLEVSDLCSSFCRVLTCICRPSRQLCQQWIPSRLFSQNHGRLQCRLGHRHVFLASPNLSILLCRRWNLDIPDYLKWSNLSFLFGVKMRTPTSLQNSPVDRRESKLNASTGRPVCCHTSRKHQEAATAPPSVTFIYHLSIPFYRHLWHSMSQNLIWYWRQKIKICKIR